MSEMITRYTTDNNPVDAYRVHLEHGGYVFRRSPIFETADEAVAWAKAHLNPTPRVAKSDKVWARRLGRNAEDFAKTEAAVIRGRKVGGKVFSTWEASVVLE